MVGMARGLISKRVKVLDCNCSFDGAKQVGAHRFDSCVCRVRTAKGKEGALEMLPETYNLGTMFIAVYPEKAWREPE